MRLLLDTHILLWWLSDDAQLSATVRSAVADGNNDVFFSAMSIAEIAIKQSLGKLDAPEDLVSLIAQEGITELPLTARHAAALLHLPWHHRDPFDRLLVAQAKVEELSLATADSSLAAYDVAIVR